MARVLSINLSSRIDSSSTSTSEYSSEENRHVKFKETPEIILDQQQEATNDEINAGEEAIHNTSDEALSNAIAMQKASFKLITDQIKEQVDNECSAAINIIKDQRNIDLVKVDSATRNYVKASKFTKKVLENVYDDIEMIEKVTKNLDCSIGAMESCLMELEDL